MTAERRGTLFGLLGILQFGATLPATKIALHGFHPVVVGLGRAVAAAVFAAIILAFTSSRWPTRSELPSLLVVIGGVILGFPLFSALAMGTVPASHGAIVVAILPLATAVFGVLRAGERPPLLFWLTTLVGSSLVTLFALRQSGGFVLADLWLAVAVVAAGAGYAEGARVAHSLGTWQVICWALVLAAPFLAVPVVAVALQQPLPTDLAPWLGFAYVAMFSQLLGFFAWYRGLAEGGIARVGQLQLIQPFITMGVAWVLLGEPIGADAVAFAVLVVATVAVGRALATRAKR